MTDRKDEIGVRRLTRRLTGRLSRRLSRRWMARIVGERGAATAEYAIVTLAAVAFAGLLVAILRSEEVRGLLLGVVQRALSLGG